MLHFCNQRDFSYSPLSYGDVCVFRLAEQMRLVAGAKRIVAPHGAGLANLVAAMPGTRVVEILSRNWFNTCYAKLSAQLGCTYRFVESRHPEEIVSKNELFHHRGLTFPIFCPLSVSRHDFTRQYASKASVKGRRQSPLSLERSEFEEP